VQPAPLLGGQAPGRPARLNACPPQHLVGEEVPQPSDGLWVDQDGLNGRAAASRAAPPAGYPVTDLLLAG
jgi:hypothetical protein